MKSKIVFLLLTMAIGLWLISINSCKEEEPEPTFTVGGTVTGATGSLVLVMGNEELTVPGNGSFTFSAQLENGAQYNVTVKTAPDGQFAEVTNGSGTINNANVTNVGVTCSDIPVDTYTVGGNVEGLTGTLVIANNGTDKLTITENGEFVFGIPIKNGSDYEVTIVSLPEGQIVEITNGSGTIDGANVTNVGISCSDIPPETYKVGGTVEGLTGTLVIANNGVDELTITENGAFSFETPLADGSAYEVSIVTQPDGELCSISNGSGTINGADVTDVTITCESNPDIGTNYFAVDASDPAIFYEFQQDKSLLAKSTNGFGTYNNVTGLAYNADNDIVYAFAAGSQKLLSVNRTTGVATELADLITTEIYDLAYDNNADILYAVNWLDGTLQSINVTTGAITDIATDMSLTRVYGLAYDSGNDILYGYKSGGGVGQLVTINTTTGLATLVGESAFLFSGLAFDQANNVLYGAQGENQDDRTMDLYEISTSDGSATKIGPTGLSSVADGGMTYVDSDGQLIASWGSGNGKLYEVDVTNGTTISIGSSGYTDAVGMAYCDADQSIYGLVIGGEINSLVTYNSESGESTYKVEVELTLGKINRALTYDDEADVFYTIVIDNNEDLHLASIDRTTGVGDTRAAIFDDKVFALAYNKEANILYGATNNEIVVIETSSGLIISEVNIDGLGGDITAMNFDPTKKVLVAVTDAKEVLAINPISGESSEITQTNVELFGITLIE
jgi:hypothetical protein